MTDVRDSGVGVCHVTPKTHQPHQILIKIVGLSWYSSHSEIEIVVGRETAVLTSSVTLILSVLERGSDCTRATLMGMAFWFVTTTLVSWLCVFLLQPHREGETRRVP